MFVSSFVSFFNPKTSRVLFFQVACVSSINTAISVKTRLPECFNWAISGSVTFAVALNLSYA